MEKAMKRLAILAVTSLFALCLTACGEHAKTEKETTTTTTSETSEPTTPASMDKAEHAAPSEAETAGATTQE